jgi:Arc/MetJ-type ribon-helix-helix transcriptional regulator
MEQETYNWRSSHMSQPQLSVRLPETIEKAIDEKRIALREELGTIPSRADVLRLALEAFLEVRFDQDKVDGRSTSGPQKRKAMRLRSKSTSNR